MATLVIGIALSYIAGRLLTPKPKAGPADTSTPVVHQRGSYLPWIVGRRRLGHVVAWVGNRRSEKRSSGGGKGGGKKQKYRVYYEEAWHLICTGPVHTLHAIYRSGKDEANLLAAPIDRDTYPSGSFIDLGNGQGFWIYWGECDQQVNTDLASRLPDNPASAWPGICYVLWNDFYLDQVASWPTIEYEVELRLTDLTPVGDSEPRLDNTTGYTGSGTIAADNAGANLAHLIYYLHTAHYPFGAGIDPATVDMGAIELLGVSAEAQHLAANPLASDGTTIQEVMSDILSDWGVALPIVNGVVSPLLMREEASPIEVPESLLEVGVIERIIALERTAVERVVYRFADVSNNFAAQDIAQEDDSGYLIRGNKRENVISLPTINHVQAASWAADRKQRESIIGGDASIFTLLRDVSAVVSGEVLELPDGQIVRVLQVTRFPLEDRVEVDAVPDVYAAQSTNPVTSTPTYVPLPTDGELVQDDFDWVEGTPALGGAIGDLVVFRANDSVGVRGASTHVSADDATYSFSEAASAEGVAGYIIDPILADDDADISGIKFRITVGTSGDFLDLTGSPTLWESGEQKMVIGNEIFYVEGITILGTGLYQFEGLKRGRDGTATNQHEAFAPFHFNQGSDIAISNNALLAAIVSPLYVKTEPYNASTTLDLSAVAPVSKTFYGAVSAPLPPVDVSANSGTNVYNTTDDIDVDFTCEEAIPEAPSVPRDGFELLIYDVDRTTVLRTLTEPSPVVGANQITYSNANIVTDFGAEPERVWMRLVAISGSYRSLPTWLEVRFTDVPAAERSPRVFETAVYGIESGYLDELLTYQAYG